MKWTEERLQTLVSDSISIAEVMRKGGVSVSSGGMYHYLSKRIKHFGIDTSHFLGRRANSGARHKGGPKKLTASEILTLRESGFKTKIHLLRRALDEIGREIVCEFCGLEDEWNGKPIVLHIDHKNGNNLDNREPNLRYLCPNCHTQTPTYGRIKTRG